MAKNKDNNQPVRDLVIIAGCITSAGHKERGENYSTRSDEETFQLIAAGRALDANTDNDDDQEVIATAKAEREARLDAAKPKAATAPANTPTAPKK